MKGRFVKKEDQAAMILSMRLEACLKDSIEVEMDEDSGGHNDDEMGKSATDMIYSDSSGTYNIKAEHGTLPMITELAEQSDEQDEEYQNIADEDEDGDDDKEEGECDISCGTNGRAAGRSSSRIEGPSGES